MKTDSSSKCCFLLKPSSIKMIREFCWRISEGNSWSRFRTTQRFDIWGKTGFLGWMFPPEESTLLWNYCEWSEDDYFAGWELVTDFGCSRLSRMRSCEAKFGKKTFQNIRHKKRLGKQRSKRANLKGNEFPVAYNNGGKTLRTSCLMKAAKIPKIKAMVNRERDLSSFSNHLDYY